MVPPTLAQGEQPLNCLWVLGYAAFAKIYLDRALG
jgi:hypothetical protein